MKSERRKIGCNRWGRLNKYYQIEYNFGAAFVTVSWSGDRNRCELKIKNKELAVHAENV